MAVEESAVDVPAKRYGFVDGEPRFIINYDIKCQMWREEEGQG